MAPSYFGVNGYSNYGTQSGTFYSQTGSTGNITRGIYSDYTASVDTELRSVLMNPYSEEGRLGLPKQVFGRFYVERDYAYSAYIIVLKACSDGAIYEFRYMLTDKVICCSNDFSIMINSVASRLESQMLQRLKEENMAEWENWVANDGTESTWIAWTTDDSVLESFKKIGVGYEEDRLKKEKEKLEAEENEEKRKVLAKDKARQLLKEVIGEISFAKYEKEHCIELLMESGKKYILHNNTHIKNIEVLDRDKDGYKFKHRLCAHLYDMELPIEDNLVAQFLMLRDSEEEFLKMANVS